MNMRYDSTQKQVRLSDTVLTVYYLSPCYPEEEREMVKKDIESRLYDIFCPYVRM